MAAPAQHAAEPDRLYRIGDVSRLTDTKPFVLRFWETEFPMLQPVKAPKGHRLYRQQDIDLIRAIKRLLYEEGFTIAGARRHLAEALAGGEGLAGLPESAPVLLSARAVHPEAAAATGQLDLLRDRGIAAGGAHPALDVPADIHGTLLAVRQELRAILTLLGTR